MRSKFPPLLSPHRNLLFIVHPHTACDIYQAKRRLNNDYNSNEQNDEKSLPISTTDVSRLSLGLEGHLHLINSLHRGSLIFTFLVFCKAKPIVPQASLPATWITRDFIPRQPCNPPECIIASVSFLSKTLSSICCVIFRHILLV